MPSLKALAVDDYAENLTLATTRFEHLGYEVVTCRSVELAIVALRDQGPFDIAAIDYRMPGLDGDALIRTMRATPAWADMPVLIISAYAEAAEVEGADAFLLMPYTRQQFEDAVAETLTKRGARRLQP
ncbi:Chemotaxis protein CheY [compost metagenome]